jgi:2'-5' RNA ligase
MLVSPPAVKIYLGLDASHVKMDLKKLKVNLNKGKNFLHQWIPEEKRFVLLCPLGTMGAEKFAELDQRIREVSLRHSPFALKFEGVWGLPDQQAARLLWVAVQNARELRALHDDLLNHFEMEEGHEYKPILPVVRLKNHRSVSDIISPHKNSEFGKYVMSDLVVYEMISGGAFPEYRLISRHKLGEGL